MRRVALGRGVAGAAELPIISRGLGRVEHEHVACLVRVRVTVRVRVRARARVRVRVRVRGGRA